MYQDQANYGIELPVSSDMFANNHDNFDSIALILDI